MSCYPELTYALYVDAELSSDEARPLESHLIHCLPCRERVVALREESEAIGNALLDRSPELADWQPRPTPARGLALGMGPAVAAGVAVTLAAGWVFEAVRPAGFEWVSPWSFKGATDMGLDLIFLLRDDAPAVFEVAVALAAMASVSALLTFSLTVVLRRWNGPSLLSLGAILALLVSAGDSQAHFGLHRHENFDLAQDEVHDGTLIASGGVVNLDGKVAGDAFVLAEQLTVRGEIDGNLVAVAGQFKLIGKVTGSVHVFSDKVDLDGDIERNLYAAADHLNLAPDAKVGMDVAIAGDKTTLEGSVGRDLYVAGDWLEIRGEVGRNARIWAEDVTLSATSEIGGNLDAALPEGTEVSVRDGAKIGGELTTRVRDFGPHPRFARFTEARFYMWLVLHLAASFAVGMLLHALLPGVFREKLETPGETFRAMAIGFLVVVAMPIALFIVACTLVGIPLALIGLGLYLAAIYIGSIVIAALIGKAIVHPADERWTSFGLALLVGLLVVIFVTHTPVVGTVARVLIILTGVGMLAERCRDSWNRMRVTVR
ncbi:MAG: hypothetical protein IH884_03450 [Myxococcales bacterium]|nr:hypothetical protein [Myxococcales bacterium]